MEKCNAVALRYKGKEITRHIALALDALSPFVKDPTCCAKYKHFESVATCLNDCTKLYKLAQATSKYFQSNGPKAAVGAFGTLLDVLRCLLQTKTLLPDGLTHQFLTADRQPKGTAGFIHMVFKKMDLAQYLETFMSQQPSVSHVAEIQNSVFPKLLSMEAATNQWLEEAVADADDETADDSNWKTQTSAGWEEFKKSVSPIAAALAELLYCLWGGDYDEELTTLAGQAMNGPAQPWHKYLDLEQVTADNRSALQEQWNEFISLVMAKPKALGENRVAADIVDLSAAGENDESAKESLQKHICCRDPRPQ